MGWQEQNLPWIVEQIPIGVAITRADGNITYANPRLCALLGEPAGSLTGRMLPELKPAHGPIRRDHEGRRGLSTLRARSGAEIAVVEAVYAARDTDGLACFIHFLQDLGDGKCAGSLAALAYYDSLTGLPNRNLFGDRLERTLLSFERSGAGLAVLYIDFDRLKPVNDALGHAAGDRLLQEAAARMSRAVRKNDTLARLGGDEFAAILEGVATPAEALRVAEKLLAAGRIPHVLAGRPVRVSLSIGIALCPRDASDAPALLMRADAAMYAAKAAGGDCCRLAATVAESPAGTAPSTYSAGIARRLRTAPGR
jgi:diguanylate cyclase (GGDEF)-like protein/PAS domain S-box-containing protein